MAAINQKIPNFLGGVSQQPDSIKFPGQVRVCDNVVPDVTFGLMKRPPGEFLKKLPNATDTGYWYEIIRDGDEKYLVQITPYARWTQNTAYAVGDYVAGWWNGNVYKCDTAGTSSATSAGPSGSGNNITDNTTRWDYDSVASKWIRIWHLQTGVEQTLTNAAGAAIFNYLVGATKPYSLQSIQDYTLITNPDVQIRKGNSHTTEPINSGNYAFARLDTIAYNTEYVLYNNTTTPNTYTHWRVTAVSVRHLPNYNVNTASTTWGNDGETWDADHDDGSKAGQKGWSFDYSSTSHNDRYCTNLEGHLTVNASIYINDNVAQYQGDDESGTPDGTGTGSQFVGYDPDYNTRYTAAVTLKNGGLITGDLDASTTTDRYITETQAKGKWTVISIEGKYYRIDVDAVEPVESYLGVPNIGYYRTPKNPDEGKLTMAKILRDLKTSVNNELANVTATVIGNGLYLYGSNAPTCNFLGGAINENMTIFGNTISDMSKLPSQCKHGYVVQVANTENTDSDNYYLKFYGDNGNDGSGTWEETVRPHDFHTPKSTASYARGGDTITVSLTSHGLSVGDKVFIDFTGGPIDGEYEVTLVQNGNTFNVKDWLYWGDISSGTTCHVSTDGMIKGFREETMPHALVNNRDGTFTLKELNETTANADSNDNYWKYREVGDEQSNPYPSFMDKKIQQIFFHRNRLGFIADEQVVMSRPGDYFNFFIVSALTVSDDNPVDITVSDVKPAFINHVLPLQKGVTMYSDNGQFLLFTESDIFSPTTARLKKLSSYECDASLQPRDMGTSVMFTSNVGAYTRAFEVTLLDDDLAPKVLEQTRVVPEYIPKTVSVSAGSASLGIVTFGAKNSSEIYHYKYYDSGERRDQSAWYSWTLTGTMQHMTYSGGTFYVVTKQGDDYILCKHEYTTDTSSNSTDTTNTGNYTVGGSSANVGSPLHTARSFEACLDNMIIPKTITYTAASGGNPEKTVLTFRTVAANGYQPTSASNFYAIGMNGTNAGMVIKADSVADNSATFNNINMTGWEVAVGYGYTSTIELPDYYFTLEANRYDTNGSLRISGINFDLGVSGPMEFHLTAKNSYVDSAGTVTKEFDDYIQYESGMITGLATLGNIPSELNKTVRVPIQKKNNKYNLQIKIPDPFSTALISASWDGIYNQRRHARK